jgi:hypothetical protein
MSRNYAETAADRSMRREGSSRNEPGRTFLFNGRSGREYCHPERPFPRKSSSGLVEHGARSASGAIRGRFRDIRDIRVRLLLLPLPFPLYF